MAGLSAAEFLLQMVTSERETVPQDEGKEVVAEEARHVASYFLPGESFDDLDSFRKQEVLGKFLFPRDVRVVEEGKLVEVKVRAYVLEGSGEAVCRAVPLTGGIRAFDKEEGEVYGSVETHSCYFSGMAGDVLAWRESYYPGGTEMGLIVWVARRP